MINATINGMDSGDEYTAWLFEQWTGVSMSSDDAESKATVEFWRSKLGLIKFRLEEVRNNPGEYVKIFTGGAGRAFVNNDSFPIYLNRDVYFKGNAQNRALVLIHETGHIEGVNHRNSGYSQAPIIASNAARGINPTPKDYREAKNNLYGFQFFVGGIIPDDPSYKYYGEGMK